MAATLPHLALVALALFAAVAAMDGVWIHLYRLRLHARPASYREHLWHTASALLFVPIVALLFVSQASGVALWIAMVLLAGLHVVEVLDVRAERESRRELGGLSRFELSMHIAAVASRSVAIAALLLARPLAIWRWDAGTTEALPSVVAQVGLAVSLGTAAIAALHVCLAIVHCPAGCRRVLVGGATP